MIEARAARWTGRAGVFIGGGGPCAQNKPTVAGVRGWGPHTVQAGAGLGRRQGRQGAHKSVKRGHKEGGCRGQICLSNVNIGFSSLQKRSGHSGPHHPDTSLLSGKSGSCDA